LPNLLLLGSVTTTQPSPKQLTSGTFKPYVLAGARVLVDPWLVGDLSFFEQGWLYTGKKRGFGRGSGVQIDVREVAGDTDVVLITQVRLVSCVMRCSSRSCAVRLVLLKRAGLGSSCAAQQVFVPSAQSRSYQMLAAATSRGCKQWQLLATCRTNGSAWHARGLPDG
jgi:hypothetical protein